MAGVRKYVTYTEEILREGHRDAEVPWRLAAALAVVENPLTGSYVQDLTPIIDMYSELLSKELGERALAALGIDGSQVEAFGKGALVGLDGEVEHGSAIIHTLRFGNPIRRLCDNAESLLPSAEKRGAAGASLDLALKHKRNVEIRSHHMTFEVRIPDAPRPGEIVVAFAVSTTGRVHARIGSLAGDANK